MTGLTAAAPRKRFLFCARIFTAGFAKRALTGASVKRNGKKGKFIHRIY